MFQMNQSILADVVHGKTHWRVLKASGVLKSGNTWQFSANRDPIYITIEDLELGFANYISDPIGRKEWAEFLLAASNLVSFEALENEKGGEALLKRLWEASSAENES